MGAQWLQALGADSMPPGAPRRWLRRRLFARWHKSAFLESIWSPRHGAVRITSPLQSWWFDFHFYGAAGNCYGNGDS